MAHIIIQRAFTGPEGTWGLFSLDGHVPECYSLELAWFGNQRGLSCIPPGTYRCRKEKHSKFGVVLRLFGVPNRDGILVHTGNTVLDVKGCIMTGTVPGRLVKRAAVLESAKAKRALFAKIPYDEDHTIEIRSIGGA